MKARRIRQGGEDWVSVNDLRAAMNDEELLLRMAAMLQVAKDKGKKGTEVLSYGVAYFFTELTGALAHHEN